MWEGLLKESVAIQALLARRISPRKRADAIRLRESVTQEGTLANEVNGRLAQMGESERESPGTRLWYGAEAKASPTIERDD
ncbi:hypothetical protein BD410DRAFT_786895 [Rickenella mellea]|uniref:Uncharacterized protein n=1 Tax=Rickenella mellea TaxID=50990 RepID=A0A4Y7Q8M3_9AGAM|nr:hypothetical protein BD410DRAFT_786895 [Rickenella mellea]